jgi:hypothetical protein
VSAKGQQDFVELIWRAHEQAIESVIDGRGEIDQERLAQAIEFFERLTGIESNTGTTFGRLPTPQLPETLQRWNRWYEENRDSLLVDPLSCRLQLDQSGAGRLPAEGTR